MPYTYGFQSKYGSISQVTIINLKVIAATLHSTRETTAQPKILKINSYNEGDMSKTQKTLLERLTTGQMRFYFTLAIAFYEDHNISLFLLS
jgi:hypothetical protein